MQGQLRELSRVSQSVTQSVDCGTVALQKAAAAAAASTGSSSIDGSTLCTLLPFISTRSSAPFPALLPLRGSSAIPACDGCLSRRASRLEAVTSYVRTHAIATLGLCGQQSLLICNSAIVVFAAYVRSGHNDSTFNTFSAHSPCRNLAPSASPTFRTSLSTPGSGSA